MTEDEFKITIRAFSLPSPFSRMTARMTAKNSTSLNQLISIVISSVGATSSSLSVMNVAKLLYGMEGYPLTLTDIRTCLQTL